MNATVLPMDDESPADATETYLYACELRHVSPNKAVLAALASETLNLVHARRVAVRSAAQLPLTLLMPGASRSQLEGCLRHCRRPTGVPRAG